jgi:DTW domain-containing protein YfiP
MMTASPVFFAVPGVHMCEELVSSCCTSADPYRRSMLRLLEYVGLQHYGTPHATVPPRTQAEDDAIAKHVEAVKEDTARHDESVRQRNIRISKRKPTSALADIINSAATAAPAELVKSGDGGSSGGTAAARQLPTIYLSFEDCAEWKAFLASVDPADRLAVTVRRRLTIELWRAHQRDLCLWCWFPRNMCMCARLDAFKAAMPAHVLDQHVEVTMLLHSEELMRSTNSGHIAAYLLGAPIRVWGMDADDLYLRELGPLSHRKVSVKAATPAPLSPLTAASNTATSSPDRPSTANAGDAVVVVYNVSLYPSSESIMIDDFIRAKHLGLAHPPTSTEEEGELRNDGGADRTNVLPQSPAECLNVAPSRAKETGTIPTPGCCGDDHHRAEADGLIGAAHKKIHLILLDSTWGQALSLNRKLSGFIPRVKLEIPDSYESLFQALRKRTRKSGVSTLEATSMAVEQCIRAMGFVADAAQSSATLTAAMKDFVDARCLLKYAAAQFTEDGAAVDDFRERRDNARRDDAARRQVILATKIQHDTAARQLLLPPVLNYCYCCDCVIGWHRVPEHVMGRSHRTALERNPSCTPSSASRQVLVPDFSRPTRAERLAEGKSKRGNEEH